MKPLRIILALLALILAPAFAMAQGALLQGDATTLGHAPMYITQGTGQTVVQDSGGAGGGGNGVGLSELGLTARGTGTAPYSGQGTGPLGTNFCELLRLRRANQQSNGLPLPLFQPECLQWRFDVYDWSSRWCGQSPGRFRRQRHDLCVPRRLRVLDCWNDRHHRRNKWSMPLYQFRRTWSAELRRDHHHGRHDRHLGRHPERSAL
jgi:hypothetical protein